MELLLPLLLLVATTIFFFLLYKNRGRAPLPPGPKPLPIIGNLLLRDRLTHRGMAALARQYGGLLHLRMGFLPVVAVSTPHFAREILQKHDNVFSNRPATMAISYLSYNRADLAFADYGPFWRQMRKLCVMKLFSRKRAESWRAVSEETDALVRSVAAGAGQTLNVGELIFKLTKDVTYRAAFGTRDGEGQDEFVGILQEFSKLFGAFHIGDFVPWLKWMDPKGIRRRLVAARAALDGFIDKIIDEHIRVGKNPDTEDADMVDGMLAYFVDDKARGGAMQNGKTGGYDDLQLQGSLKLTRDNIKAIIMDVMFGGTETVASGIEWALSEMLHSPDDLRRVQQELAEVVGLDRQVVESDLDKLPFFQCVIKETLRLHPPIPMLNHQTSEDCVVAGYHVPGKARILINVYAIGRDKTAWKDPDTFRPSRFTPGGEAEALDFKGSCFEFLPFGSGRRSCPGMQLGLYSLDLAVAQLVHCFNWALPDGMKPSEMDMSDQFGLTAPRAKRLYAIPTPRLTCSLC